MENKTQEYELSIVVPVYNERESLPRVEKAMSEYASRASMPCCIVFVDDGSTDGSTEAIKDICSRHDNMFYIICRRNGGLSAALKAGFDAVASQYVAYIDADLQTSPDDFELLLPYIGEYPLVTGIRTGRKDGFVKKCSSRIANGWRRMMTHDDAIDTGCPLKVMWTRSAKRLPMFTGMHRFIPALILLQEGGKYRQIPVRHFPRTEGKSKYHLWNRLAGPFNDCFAYRWMKPRYINYNVEDTNLR